MGMHGYRSRLSISRRVRRDLNEHDFRSLDWIVLAESEAKSIDLACVDGMAGIHDLDIYQPFSEIRGFD